MSLQGIDAGGTDAFQTTQNAKTKRFRRRVTFIDRLMAPSLTHMQVLQVISGLVTVWALLFSGAAWWWWAIALVAYFFTGCLGLTMTLHRALTHRSVIFPKPIEHAFTLFGVFGGTGSSIAWTSMHRAHHANVDTEDDPHSPEKLGWKILFSVYDYEFDPRYARDLIRSRFHVFVHRFYAPILALWALGLALIHPLAAVFVFFVPVFVQITVSNLTSILTHSSGYRTFETKDESSNNWLIGLLAWGEGWHNNHHARPSNAYFQNKWWEVDAGGLCIAGMARLGLAEIRE